MKTTALLDKRKKRWLESGQAPTRTITYTKFADNTSLEKEAIVGGGSFNKDEKETLSDFQAFGGLYMTTEPEVGDEVIFNSQTFEVKRYERLGETYRVYGRISRHSGRPKG